MLNQTDCLDIFDERLKELVNNSFVTVCVNDNFVVICGLFMIE